MINEFQKVTGPKKVLKERHHTAVGLEILDTDNKILRKKLRAKNQANRVSMHSSDAVLNRPSQLKKKKTTVPEVNMVSECTQIKDRKQNLSKTVKRSFLVQPQADNENNDRHIVKAGNVCPKSAKANAEKGHMLSPYFGSNTSLLETYDAQDLFGSSPRKCIEAPPDLENIPPNLPPSESFFECDRSDLFYSTQFSDYEKADLSSEIEDFRTCSFQEPASKLKMPPLEPNMPNCSTKTLSNFKNFLKQHEANSQLLEPNEVIVLRDVVKADERYRNIRKDDIVLLKEILLSQLDEIKQQEKVIKVALEKLRVNGQKTKNVSKKTDVAEQPMEREKLRAAAVCKTKDNAIARNIKQQDIIKKTSPGNVRSTEMSLSFCRTSQMYHAQNTACEYNASAEIYLLGVLQISYLVQEFDIRYQSVDELKQGKDFFFLPMDAAKFELTRTNFEKLSHTPEVLMRCLKTNAIEQNPEIFNNFLVNWSKMWCAENVDNHCIYIPSEVKLRSNLHLAKMLMPAKYGAFGAAGDHVYPIRQLIENISKSNVPASEPIAVPNKEKSQVTKIKNKTRSPNRSQKRMKLRRVHQKKSRASLRYLCLENFADGTSQWTKSLLVGSLQITLFVLLIMAFTYPDLECL